MPIDWAVEYARFSKPHPYREASPSIIIGTKKMEIGMHPAHDIPIMMAELVKYLNSEAETHLALVSGIAQFQLVHIHPVDYYAIFSTL
ncbi:hypothetical protein ACFLZM_03365 [Thermodesulfobacteriota bacterium]